MRSIWLASLSELSGVARRRRCPRAASGAQGHRLCVGTARARRRRAWHFHRHAGRRRRRERHTSANLRREGHARLVTPRRELPATRAPGGARRASSAVGTRSCRRRSSPPGARRAGIPRGCARRLPTFMRKRRRSAWRAISAIPFRHFRIRASRRPRTRWRSSRLASHRRHPANGSTWRGCLPRRTSRLAVPGALRLRRYSSSTFARVDLIRPRRTLLSTRRR